MKAFLHARSLWRLAKLRYDRNRKKEKNAVKRNNRIKQRHEKRNKSRHGQVYVLFFFAIRLSFVQQFSFFSLSFFVSRFIV
jgi:hypothetical protein